MIWIHVSAVAIYVQEVIMFSWTVSGFVRAFNVVRSIWYDLWYLVRSVISCTTCNLWYDLWSIETLFHTMICGIGMIAHTCTNPQICTIKGVFAIDIYQTLLCWKTCKILVWKPTNPPTQGQPNPRRNRLKSGIRATFSHSKYFFLGWDWFYTRNRLQETQPNRRIVIRPASETFSFFDVFACGHRWSWSLSTTAAWGSSSSPAPTPSTNSARFVPPSVLGIFVGRVFGYGRGMA